MTLFPEYYFRSTLSVSDWSKRERERVEGGESVCPVFSLCVLAWVTFTSTRTSTSLSSAASKVTTYWASGVSCFQGKCWRMGRGPDLRYKYCKLHETRIVCGTRSRITRAILCSLEYFMCNAISELCVGRDPVLREPFFVLSSISCVTLYQNCVWDKIPYYESHSLFSRVFHV